MLSLSSSRVSVRVFSLLVSDIFMNSPALSMLVIGIERFGELKVVIQFVRNIIRCIKMVGGTIFVNAGIEWGDVFQQAVLQFISQMLLL